jgi:hypothetical protein
MIEKRAAPHTPFQEKLSSRMLMIAGVGAILVLLDPKMIIPLGADISLRIGGEGFSNDLKGMVIGAILVGGFNSIREFWLGTSVGGQKAADLVGRVAEAAAPAAVTALALAANQHPPWERNYEYKVGEIVNSPNGASHVCMVQHTSSDWVTDLAAGKWAPKT